MSTGGLQRAIGQMDQYRERYGNNLMVLLLPDFITETQKQLFIRDVKTRGVEILEK